MINLEELTDEELAEAVTEWVKSKRVKTSRKSLADYAPAEIAAIAKSSKASEYFSVGDETSMTLLSGEVLIVRIVDFNHDDLADGSGKAGITFDFKHVLDGRFEMNEECTNKGGWEDSKARKVYMQRIYELMPPEWKAVIKTVAKPTSIGETSTHIYNSKDKLFLASEVEIFGETKYSYTGEGEQYALYKDEKNRIKTRYNGSPAYWWLRSPYYDDGTHFCDVDEYGGGDSYCADCSLGLAPLFAV